MNRKIKKLIYLLVLECNASRKKLVDLWDRTDKISIRFKFSLFVKEKYKDLQSQMKDIPKQQLLLELKEQWKRLSDDEKIKYMVVEEKKPRKKSAYHCFYKAQYKILKETDKDLSLGDISKKVSSLWKKMTTSEKLQYLDLHRNMPLAKTATEATEATEAIEAIEAPKTTIEATETTETTEATEATEATVPNKSPEDNILEQTDGENEDEDRYERIKTTIQDLNEDPDHKILVNISQDKFLTETEKNQINGICLCLSEKPIQQARKMYETCYDEQLADDTHLDEILQKVYRHERKNYISRNYNEKINLIPKEALVLTREEQNYVEKTLKSFEKMEHWTLYCKFRAVHPHYEEMEGSEEMAKEEIIQRLGAYETDRILKLKIYRILEIN